MTATKIRKTQTAAGGRGKPAPGGTKAKARPGPLSDLPPGVHEVPIAAITRDPRFQPRDKMDPRTVRSYAISLRSQLDHPDIAQQQFPPVIVGRIDGVPYLLDGWHRTAAHERAGQRTIRADIRDVTIREAESLSRRANLMHGKQLTRAEMRDAFDAFVRAGRYRRKGGGYLTYEEMAAALPNVGDASTLWRWMKARHRAVWERLSGKPGGEGDTTKLPDAEWVYFQAAQGHLISAVTQARHVRDHVRLETLIAQAQQTVRSLEALAEDEFDQAPEDEEVPQGPPGPPGSPEGT